MTTVATLLVRMRADSTNLIAGIGKAQVSFRALLSIATKVAAGIGVVSAGIVFLSVKLAIDFESAMAGVRKTVEATDSQFATLKRGIEDLSKRIPIAATEIAGVAEAAGQLGVAVEDIILFTEEMLKLGVTTDLSAREGAIALARFTNVMNTPIEKIGNLVATLVGLGNNVAATEAEILTFAVRLAKTGAVVGLTEADVLGLSAGLTELGIRAELGSTAFSRVFAEMASAVATGGKQLDRFAAVAGMSAIEFGKLFKDNAVEALVLFVEGLGDLKDADQNVFAFLDELGLDAVRVRDSLFGAALGSVGLRDALALAKQEFEDGTAATIEFELRLETAASKFSIFKNKITLTGIKIGEALLPLVLDDLDRLSDWFERNEDTIISFFVNFGDAIATVVSNTSLLVKDIVAISQFIGDFSTKVTGGKKRRDPGGTIGGPAAPLVGVIPFTDITGGLAAADIQKQAEATATAFEKVLAASSNSQLIALSERIGDEMSEAFTLLAQIVDFAKKPTPEDFEGLTAKEVVQLTKDSNRNARDVESILKGISINLTRLGTDLRSIDTEQRVRAARLTGITSTTDIDEINAFKEFLRGPSADAIKADGAVATTTEQQERLDAAFGGAADGVNRLLSALQDFAAFRTEQRIETFFRSGTEGVIKLEAEFAKLDTAWAAILPGLRALGEEVPEQWRIMFDRVNTETIDGARRLGSSLGGLLGVLLARRLQAGERFGDTDARAGLTTREVQTGGGTGTVIQIEQLNIGEGAQTTTGEIATGIADGARQALGAQAVGT